MPINQQPHISEIDADILPEQSDWNYEDALAKAETIIDSIESGKLSLAQVFDRFHLASEYLHQCESFLQERQQQMAIYVEDLEERG
jgi:exodeoxyribonuclease VII small subunit